MGDNRVSPLLKLLPIGSALYFIIPDLAIGPMDDVAVVWLGTYLFVELCPPEIVEEHMAALRNQALPGEWHDPESGTGRSDRWGVLGKERVIRISSREMGVPRLVSMNI